MDNSGHGIIAWIIIGIIAGWITGKLMKGSGFGVIMDMVVGLVGALIGGFISSRLGWGGAGDHGLIISIVIAVIGAVILTWIVRLVTGSRSTNL
ncbi:MAG: GlsB/YeaQ/YmgE family stress response membrane protein [Acidobacteriaceae bacterium]